MESIPLELKPRRTPQARRQRIDRILGVVAITTVVIAWIVGASRAKADLWPAIEAVFPEADHITHSDHEGDLYMAWADGDEEHLIGYVALGEANGYGGPLTMAVGVDANGEIISLSIAQEKETPSWSTRIRNSDFVSSLLGKSYDEAFKVGEDVDAITGATVSSKGIAEAVLNGGQIAARHIGLPVAPLPAPEIVFGIPEIVLIALFAVGYVAHQAQFKYKKQARWATLITGMVVLGFIYNAPVTLAYINKFLMGFWPEWQSNLYWYILIGGIIFVFTIDNKNPYCEWFCPFGAAQECMGLIGGAKVRSPGNYRQFLKWLQRGLAWLAVVLALLYRSPGLTSYEIFGTLFELIGSNFQFILLAIVLLAALFIKRPWCNYLCPLDPVVDFIRMVRKWILDIWKRQRVKRAA
ncbi:MAG: FMN-binding protein [Chloroflexi bacterium]|nr:MAG: FMN-binding protein [Chloroflexota bacterium]MBL1194873.1 FMN-binding protein [Chloroflexota bacterium]NOH12164.1 FMN-binding protein [Chloroflexota bacterium]